MTAAVLSDVPPAPTSQRAVAVFVSGLPGSGKSAIATALAEAAALSWPPRLELAVVDADALRGFHGQYALLENDPQLQCFEDAVPWWLDGSGFEQAVFRDPDGLMAQIFATRRSFLQLTVMHSDENLRWARHVAEKGYEMHLLLVHTDTDVAVARARARASRTGRWCPEPYLRACAPGLRSRSRELARMCAATGGSVRLLDNTADAGDRAPDGVALLAAPLRPRVASAYGMRAQMLSHERIRAFADAQLARLPPGAMDGVDACIAGGAFRALLHAPPAPPPRDLDLWPRTSRDEAMLLRRLAPQATRVTSGRWNTVLKLVDEAGLELQVDVVRAHGRGLKETMSFFDIALAAVGACASRVSSDRAAAIEEDDVFVHQDALRSVETRELLLLPGALRGVNAVGSAERLLRYARELRWPLPAVALRELEAAFRAAAPDARAALLKAHRGTSMGGEDAAEVACRFGFDASMTNDE